MDDVKDLKNKVRLRSDPVRDILKAKPNWIVRYGIAIIIFFVVTIILLCDYVMIDDVGTSLFDYIVKHLFNMKMV